VALQSVPEISAMNGMAVMGVPNVAGQQHIYVLADQIDEQFGLDTEEALCRFEQAGGCAGGVDAKAWVSVAFLLSRWQKGLKRGR
jgi:hypothetical protein